MSKIQDIVDSLEDRINRLLNKLESLKESNLELNQKLSVSQQKISEQGKTIDSWEEKYESLSKNDVSVYIPENKRETKLKINALIREIDHCIGQLSE